MVAYMNSLRLQPIRRILLAIALIALSTGVLVITSTAANAQTSASQDKIIVSGASGQLGGLVVQGLLARGVPAKNLILVSRTPDTLASYAKQGATVRFGDFEKPESLAAAYAGGTRMLLISIGFSKTPRPQSHGRAIEAAKAAGVKQIAYTSWIALSKGDTSGLGADHSQTEEILKKSGVAYTFLRNSIYQDAIVAAAAKMVADGKAVAVPNENKIGYVTREDCAAAAVAVLSTPGHENKAYEITGPELLGQAEIAAAAGAVSGKAIPVVQPEPGAPPPRAFGGPSASIVSGDVQKLTGRAPTSFKTFLESNKVKLTATQT
jgi:NAD(P)H dehydrogenase (quinone)